MRGALLVIFFAALLGGCATAMMTDAGDPETRQPETERNRTLKAAVIQTLVRDPSVPAMDIDVETQSGEVTLSGRVPSYKAARRAEELTRQIPGVRGVEVRLAIEP